MVIAGDDLGIFVVFRILGLRRAILLLAGRIEELERQLAGVGEIPARHLFELVEPAHRPVEVEREDEVAEDHVGAGLHERLRHAEAVERADHQHALPVQFDAERLVHERDGLALERVLQAADDRRLLHGLEQPNAVTQRVAVLPGVQVHVDAAEADRIDRPVERLEPRDRPIDRAVRPHPRDIEPLPEQLHLRPMIARRRTQRNADDRFHALSP